MPEIILDGVSYNISNFSQTVQAMVNVRARWENDLAEERAKALKTESAIRALDAQLTAVVQEELKAKADASTPAEPTQPAEASNDTKAQVEPGPPAADPVKAPAKKPAKKPAKVTPLKKPAKKSK